MIGQVSPTAFKQIGMYTSITWDYTDVVGWKYYLVFTVCSFTNAILFFCLFPETNGVSSFRFALNRTDSKANFGRDGPVLPRQLLVCAFVQDRSCRFQGQGEGSRDG